jgi:hypothetical protein
VNAIAIDVRIPPADQIRREQVAIPMYGTGEASTSMKWISSMAASVSPRESPLIPDKQASGWMRAARLLEQAVCSAVPQSHEYRGRGLLKVVQDVYASG